MHDPETKRFGALPSVAGGLTRLAYAQAKAARLDTDSLLKKAGITQQQIDDPALRLNVRDQIRFLNLVADALPDDFLGFHLALPAEPREIGLLYYVAASSETLGQALQQAARYSSIVNEGVRLKYRNSDVGISFDYVGVSRHLDRHQIEFYAAMTVRICRQLTGQPVGPTRVRLTHHRDSISPEFTEFFGDNVEFGAAVDEVVICSIDRPLAGRQRRPLPQQASGQLLRRGIGAPARKPRFIPLSRRECHRPAAAAREGAGCRNRAPAWREPTDLCAAADSGRRDVFRSAGKPEIVSCPALSRRRVACRSPRSRGCSAIRRSARSRMPSSAGPARRRARRGLRTASGCTSGSSAYSRAVLPF